MRQKLSWANGCKRKALPIAADLRYPFLGLVLRPESAAVSMSGSSSLVATNAVLLKRLRIPTGNETTPTEGRCVIAQKHDDPTPPPASPQECM